jgi:hypothetical protein
MAAGAAHLGGFGQLAAGMGNGNGNPGNGNPGAPNGNPNDLGNSQLEGKKKKVKKEDEESIKSKGRKGLSSVVRVDGKK